MVFVPPHDRVAETSTSNSQSVFAMSAALDTSYNRFSASMSVNDTTIGGVVEPGVAFKTGILKYSNTNEITVLTTFESKGTFSSSGTKQVFMGQPGLSQLLVDGAQTLSATQQAQGANNLSVASGAASQSLSSAVKNQLQKNAGLPAIMRSYLAGLGLSTPGSSATFAVAAGVAADSTNADMMTLATAISKTTGSWSVGSTNGSLDVGSIANNAYYFPFLIKRLDTQVVDVLTSLSPGTSSVVIISNASPAQVTWTNHGLQANAPVVFTTTGALPTGLTAGTQYFVKTVVDDNTFTLSATQGGTAINTSGAGSGTHTANASPILPANYTLFRRIGWLKTNGSAQWILFVQTGDDFEWAISPPLDINVSNPGTSAVLRLLSVPPGIKVVAKMSAYILNASGVANGGTYFSDPDTPDLDPVSVANIALGILNLNTTNVSLQVSCYTNTAGKIRTRAIGSSASTGLTVNTLGCTDRRGRDA